MSETMHSPLDAQTFRFWYPSAGMSLSIGEGEEMPLPQIPLPLFVNDVPTEPFAMPSERLLGDALYEYLCTFPDCEHAADYAEILRQAYPFLIADLGSQLMVLDIKNTEASALKRRIALLKIMLYLDPDNFGLLHKLGTAYFYLGLHPDELLSIEEHLTMARRWLEQARRRRPDNISNLNLVGQVCYLGGKYHQAKLYWQSAVNLAKPQDQLDPLKQRIETLAQGMLPQRPLLKSLKQVGLAKKHYCDNAFDTAHALIETLVRQGDIPRELPSVDFYYFLGLCREKVQDYAGAYEAFVTATELDEKHELSRQALERVSP